MIEKPTNYDEIQLNENFTPIELGGHKGVIMGAEKYTSDFSGNTSLKVSVDTDKDDKQPNYFTDMPGRFLLSGPAAGLHRTRVSAVRGDPWLLSPLGGFRLGDGVVRGRAEDRRGVRAVPVVESVAVRRRARVRRPADAGLQPGNALRAGVRHVLRPPRGVVAGESARRVRDVPAARRRHARPRGPVLGRGDLRECRSAASPLDHGALHHVRHRVFPVAALDAPPSAGET